MFGLRKKPKLLRVDFKELSQYTEDIERITNLRNKCPIKEERERYDNVIKCMQLAMEFLNNKIAKGEISYE